MSRRAPGASVDGLVTFDDIFARWLDAEARGDAAALDALLDVDFRGDGPHGFVLTKHEWLDRYRQGDLVNHAFGWHDVHLRVHGDTVVVRGIQAHRGRHRGEDRAGRFRATLVAVRRGDRWSIVNLQLSDLAERP
jgi:ketosteroid isomerase-like protein